MRVSGFVYLRKRKRGDSWYAKFRIGDERFNRKLGPAWNEKGRPPDGYYTKRKAQAELQAILTDARRGRTGLHDATVGRTYQEAVNEWLRYVESRGRSGSTLNDYERTTKKRLIPAFGKEAPVRSITTGKIEKVREDWLAEGELSRRTIQKLLAFNFGILKRAKRLGWIATNPAEDAERVTLKRSGDFNVLSPEEVAAVVRAAKDDQDKALITVAAYTGLRLGELRGLRWRDVDFAKRTIFVRENWVRNERKKPKSGKVRSVPLIDQTAKALDDLSRRDNFVEPDDLVFIKEAGNYIDDKETRRALYAALKKAGLGHKREGERPMVFHDLRHTFGTLAVQVWPLVDVQAYMGHANISTTMIYAHHVPKHDAADALTALVNADGSETVRARFASR
jgi:integrase